MIIFIINLTVLSGHKLEHSKEALVTNVRYTEWKIIKMCSK